LRAAGEIAPAERGFMMLADIITDRRAWKADTIDDRAAWYYRLSEASLAALEQTIQAWRRAPQPVTDLRLSDYPCAACSEDLRPVLYALEHGRGFAIVDRLPVGRYTVQELQALYWLISQALGRPFEQNVQGTLLYDVRDTGQDVQYGARFSITNAESTFHTDNSFGDEVLDYVGLLCLRTAQAGGRSQVVSAYAAHNELLEKHPGVLEVLYQPLPVDRRGGVRAGESPTARRPVLEWDGRALICRYLRFWIEAGHAKIGQPLTAAQVGALDILDRVLRRTDLPAEFELEPGQIFYMNNRWLFHNRTAFEDYSDPERRRHYVRLWLRARR